MYSFHSFKKNNSFDEFLFTPLKDTPHFIFDNTVTRGLSVIYFVMAAFTFPVVNNMEEQEHKDIGFNERSQETSTSPVDELPEYVSTSSDEFNAERREKIKKRTALLHAEILDKLRNYEDARLESFTLSRQSDHIGQAALKIIDIEMTRKGYSTELISVYGHCKNKQAYDLKIGYSVKDDAKSVLRALKQQQQQQQQDTDTMQKKN